MVHKEQAVHYSRPTPALRRATPPSERTVIEVGWRAFEEEKGRRKKKKMQQQQIETIRSIILLLLYYYYNNIIIVSINILPTAV